MTNILLTGGTGFVGSAILRDKAFSGTLVVGRKVPNIDCNYKVIDFYDDENLKKVLTDIDVVIHLSARAHVMNETSNDPAKEYFNANTDLTLRLARHSADLGVSRFIFLSTIKTLGEHTCAGEKFDSSSPYNPKGLYAQSKVAAEIGLQTIVSSSQMKYVIIRPPLIYGEGTKGNLQKLTKLIKSGFPFPIPSVENKRSLLSVENLIDFIKLCLTDDRAANKTFLVSDDCDLSTSELVATLASSIGLPNRSIKIPNYLLRSVLMLIGQRAAYDRLSTSLSIDITETKQIMGWKPPYTPDEMLPNCLRKSND